jgi:hypothetical protein
VCDPRSRFYVQVYSFNNTAYCTYPCTYYSPPLQIHR